MTISIKSLGFSLAICLFSATTIVVLNFDDDAIKDITTTGTHHDHRQGTATYIPLPAGLVGPESFAFDAAGGGPYTGVSDGRIIRWLPNETRWVDFAVTSPERIGCEGGGENIEMEHKCGRPLGLQFNKRTGDLYIADAYMGLLVVDPNGGLANPISKGVDGLAFGFTNSLDIDQSSGIIYFTDSSAQYPRRSYISVMITSDNTGRLLQFNPQTNITTIVLDNLKFPNGVALSKNGDFLLFTETTTCKLYKFWLKTPKEGTLELMADLLGFPDNIKRNTDGEFWVGINSKKGWFTNWILSNPWIGRLFVNTIKMDFTTLYMRMSGLLGGSMGMGVRLDEDGKVVEVLDYGKGKRWGYVSEVDENNGSLWIGSVTRSFVIKDKKNWLLQVDQYRGLGNEED